MNKRLIYDIVWIFMFLALLIISINYFGLDPYVEEKQIVAYQQGYKQAELYYAQIRAVPVPIQQTITNETTNETTTINQISAFPICTDLFIQSYQQICGGTN